MANYLVPGDLRYSKTHEWIKDLGGNKFRVGISDYAAKHIGDVTYVELPQVDDEIGKEESGCVIETVKSSEDVYNSITGKVIAENGDILNDNPETINNDCYGEGWLYEIQAASADDFKALMSPADYEKFLAELGD
ncbi:MAG TPA: glycine cleavage system protein GcvH [bacterium]|nr:glycine cleavage system protein GcvH [bacterium]